LKQIIEHDNSCYEDSASRRFRLPLAWDILWVWMPSRSPSINFMGYNFCRRFEEGR